MKKVLQKTAAFFLGLVIAFVILEIFLRIYNPFPARVRGDKIELKSNFKRTKVIDPPVNGLDKEVNYALNSIGFRGEDPGDDREKQFSIITVGGSTTDCSLLSEEKTWPDQLYKRLKNDFGDKVWLNNAGIDGASTYGHQILLDDYLVDLKPDMILFLTGINDHGRASFENETAILQDRDESFLKKLARKSEVLMLISNLIRRAQAQEVGIGHSVENTLHTEIYENEAERLQKDEKYLPVYENRLEGLVKTCKENGIEPILMTQSLLADTSASFWKVIDLYNDVNRKVAKNNGLFLIDLGAQLPIRMEYYYDRMHYTNAGADAVGQLIYQELKKHLTIKQPDKLY